jgi:phenylacetate-CoA ligase
MSLLRKVYEAAPVWLQNVMVSGQGYIHKHKRIDVAMARSILADLRESQWWSTEEFRRFQDHKLRERINYATRHIPYYAKLFRDLGMNSDDIRCAADLRKIPILEKAAVREQPKAFLKGGEVNTSWYEATTSGTTGTPLAVYLSRDDFTRIWGFVFRLREWAGLRDPILPRRVSTTGKDIVPIKSAEKTNTYWRYDFPNNALLLSCGPISKETVPLIAAAIKRFEPELITGLPSVLTLIAKYATRNGISLPQPKAIITTAETLLDHDRRRIETSFGSKVYNQYASTDTSAFISECEHGSLHVNPEFGICELLDPQGNLVKPGELGEIVATSFCNMAQVFIRYRTGDWAIAGSKETCACGRSMPRIKSIEGRTDDVVVVRGQGYIGSTDSIFSVSQALLEAQIVQESLDVISLNLVPDSDYNETVEAGLLKDLRDRVGEDVTIIVNKLDQIPRGPNGKFRNIVCKCTPEDLRI